MMNKPVILTAVLCFLLGFTGVLQIRSVSIGNEIKAEAERAEKTQLEDIRLELETQKAINDGLNQQIAQYRGDIEELQNQADDADGYTSLLNTRLERANIMAGLTEVVGPGVTITVTDKQSSNTVTSDGVNLYVVHQEDLLKIINELCDADAEAISLNGERIIATSEIRCAGATVSVNNRRYSAPFVIKAIGNPDNLTGALNMRDGVVDSLSQWLNINIAKSESVTIPAYTGTVSYNYAKPSSKEVSE